MDTISAKALAPSAPQRNSIAQEWDKLAPFIALDRLDAQLLAGAQVMAASGKAIITYVLTGAADYRDSTGKHGLLKAGDWVWIISGAGIGYSITPRTSDCRALQACIALTPALENAPAQSALVNPGVPATSGPVEVLIGWHDKIRSEFATPSQLNYCLVRLKAGQRWHYELPLNHTLAWLALVDGQVQTGSEELRPLHPRAFSRTGRVECIALSDALLALGSTMDFGYDLVTQGDSVHTSSEALQIGLQGVDQARKNAI